MLATIGPVVSVGGNCIRFGSDIIRRTTWDASPALARQSETAGSEGQQPVQSGGHRFKAAAAGSNP